MDFYKWTVIVFLMFSLLVILFASRQDPEEMTLSQSATIKELRARQIKGFREHAVKRKFEDLVEERAGMNKKMDTENQLMRAGFKNVSYGEFLITRIGLAALAFIVSWLFLNHIVISLVSVLAFYLLPEQIVTFIANRRISLLESDIGTFIQLTIERYKVHGDFQKAVKQSAPDFEGHEPMYSEIRQTILDFNVGTPTTEAMESLAKRTGNKFISQLANYYDIASTIGTEASRDKIIGQAWENFNEDYKMKKQHELEIDGPKKDAYIIVGALPLLMIYQATVDENYVNFFLNTPLGKIGLGIILITMIMCLVFINKKVGAPLD